MSEARLSSGFSWLLTSFLATLALPQFATAQDSSTLSSVELYATFNSIGIRASVSGDLDGDAIVTATWGPLGQGEVYPAHDLLPLPGGAWAGSIFFLDPATEYEVVVTLEDPDNQAVQQAVRVTRTRTDVLPGSGYGRIIHVDQVHGRDENSGDEGEPVATIGAGLLEAEPGDTVLVHAGTYRETVKPERSGTAAAPIHILADDTAGPVVVSGADPQIEAEARWNELHDGIFWTPFDGACDYLAADQARIYDYDSLDSLEAEQAGISGGFFVSKDEARLYLRLPDRGNPANSVIHCATLDRAFVLNEVENIVIEGFRVRYFGGVALDLYDSHAVWIRHNYIHHTGGGIRLRYRSSENVVENNWIRDTSVYNWPWRSVKWHTPEQTGINVGGGWGNVVRGNLVQGVFNGIYLGRWGDADWDIASETDVHDNLILNSGDDGFEPEGACVNQRIWGNVSIGSHNAVSLSPVEVGPVWVVRNLLIGFKDHAFKINNSPEGWMLIYHTTTVPNEEADDAQPLAPPDPMGGLISRNNIYWGRRYALEYMPTETLGVVDLDYDDMWSSHTTGSGYIVKWLNTRYEHVTDFADATAHEIHGYEEVPLFTAAHDGDFSLVDGHPLLNAGVLIPGINDRDCPGGPDIGAIEKGGMEPLAFNPGFEAQARFGAFRN